MNANIQFGRRIRPTEVTDVQFNAVQILYNELSQSSKTSNITVGAEPYILVAFGLVANQKIVVNNVFQNIDEPLYYDGSPIELTATNNIVILAVAGIYNCETVEPLGTFTLIGYSATAIDTKLNTSVAVTNPNGPHSQLPNTFFSGIAGITYSQDFYVGATPFVFRAYGITTQTIELEALFQDKVVTVIEDGAAVTMSAFDTTLIVSVAGRYRLKIVGSSLSVVVANNPTTINYTDPFLKKGDKGDKGAPGANGVGYTHTQGTAADTWTINHNLNLYPSVELFTVGGAEFDAEVINISLNQTKVYMSSAMAGSARLN